MIRCSGCGFDNPDDAAICLRCAQALLARVACYACGHPNRAGSRFCNDCGSPLSSGATPAGLAVAEEQARGEPVAQGFEQGFESEVPAGLAEAPTAGDEGFTHLPAEYWQETSRLVASLAEEGGETGAEQPDFGIEVPVGDEQEPAAGAVHYVAPSLALAECLADRGSGPPFAPKAVPPPALDVEKLAILLAQAIAAEPPAVKIAKGRPVWQMGGR